MTDKEFVDKVLKEFKTNASPAEVVYKLIDLGLLRDIEKRNYIIRAEWPEALRRNSLVCANAVADIAVEHNITPRQVQYIIYKKETK